MDKEIIEAAQIIASAMNEGNHWRDILTQMVINIIPIGIGAWLAYRFALKQFKKENQREKRDKIKWKACQEEWIPLAETITDIQYELEVENNFNVISDNWNGNCFQKNEKQENNFSEIFSYLRPAKRGMIKSVIKEIESLQKNLIDYNKFLDNEVKKIIAFIEDDIKDIMSRMVDFDIDGIDIRYKKDLDQFIRTEILYGNPQRECFGLIDYINGISSINYKSVQTIEFDFSADTLSEKQMVEDGCMKISEEDPLNMHFDAIGLFEKYIPNTQDKVYEMVKDFKYDNYTPEDINNIIVKQLYIIKNKLRTLIDQEYVDMDE